jgi:ABC-type phosphate transport system ATPase subunit
MKNILKISITTLLITIFIGCGGSGDDSSFKNSEEIIQIVDCNSTTGYTTVETGDVVIQNNSSVETKIKTVFNTDSSKKVCVLSGSAHIIRK